VRALPERLAQLQGAGAAPLRAVDGGAA
jgi:hypothetical protein